MISIHAPRTGSDNTPTPPAGDERDFNPRSPHGERPDAPESGKHCQLISIHAPRTGSDPATNNCQGVADISIPAPRTGRDNDGDDEPCVHARFQSTLPARGATRSGCWISRAKEPFQSTLPARGATWRASAAKKPASYFNPRSPHGERRPSAAQSTRFTNFNPRSPHGERPHLRRSSGVRNGFQSTLPARGATP